MSRASREVSPATVIRMLAGLGSKDRAPIAVVKHGWNEPIPAGKSYYWTTPGGTRVRHPSAFARRGWPTVYWASTRCVKVTHAWLAAFMPGAIAADALGRVRL